MSLKTKSFTFDEFILDSEEKTLFRKGESISITPKIYDLLFLLITNSGHLVEKKVIMDTVWKDSFVEDSNLTYSIRQLRKILGDDAKNPRYIETVPRRGYRFIAEVSTSYQSLNHTVRKNENNQKEFFLNHSISSKIFTQRNFLLLTAVSVLIVSSIFLINSQLANNQTNISKQLNLKALKTKGKFLSATISPDGKYFAYTDESNEKISVWLQNIETSEKKQILPPSNHQYYKLSFSNDGNSLYFVRKKQIGSNYANLYKVSLLGGKPTSITERVEGKFGLSPDDKMIAYVKYNDSNSCNLYIADSDGKNEQKLIEKKFPITIRSPEFSPDGQSIVYATGQADEGTNNFRLVKINLQNKVESEISPQTFYHIKSLVLTPSGKDLYFAGSTAPGKPYEIWRVSNKTGKATKLREETSSYMNLSLDKVGNKLLAVKKTNSFQLSFSSIINPNKTKVLTSASTARFISNEEITYSTDDGDLWKIDVNGQEKHHLTDTYSNNIAPLSSPDGKYIYYMSNRSGAYQIWRMNIDRSNQFQITKKTGSFPISISSDQNHLFFESRITGTLWKVATDGKSVEKEFWDKKLFNSRFSKDGSKIAYLHRDKSKNNQTFIGISDVKNKTLIQKLSLSEKGLKPIKVDWFNDNQTLIFIAKDESSYKLWKQKVGANSPTFMADLGKELIRDFSISPNGKNFILIRGEWLQDVVLIERVS